MPLDVRRLLGYVCQWNSVDRTNARLWEICRAFNSELLFNLWLWSVERCRWWWEKCSGQSALLQGYLPCWDRLGATWLRLFTSERTRSGSIELSKVKLTQFGVFIEVTILLKMYDHPAQKIPRGPLGLMSLRLDASG